MPDVEYRAGKNHCNADCLSRLPVGPDYIEILLPGDMLMLEARERPLFTVHKIRVASQKDVVLSQVYRWVLHG